MLFRAAEDEGKHGSGGFLWVVSLDSKGGVLIRHYLLRLLFGEVLENLQGTAKFFKATRHPICGGEYREVVARKLLR